MPGKLLSEADLESDTAMAKVEMPRKRNEKVPPGAERLGARQDAEGGAAAKRRGPGWGRVARRANPACPETRVSFGQGASGGGRCSPRAVGALPRGPGGSELESGPGVPRGP